MNTKSAQRVYYIDWLRVFAILSVFVYHSTRFFDPWFWHVKNPTTYNSVAALQGFMEIWMMPFIFLISGASIFYAMNKGGAGTFFKDKALRLFVPLLVAVFTYAPLQVYLERITHGQFSGSFFAFLPHYFEGVYMGDGSAGNFAFVGMHMWYVFILLLYCLMFYPLFRWWKGSGHRVLEIIGNLLASPWTMWLVPAFPILTLHLFVSDTDWEFGSGGWPFLYYIFFLLYGFVIASNERLQANIKRMRWFNLALGVLFSAAFIVLKANPALAELEDALGDLFWILSACSLLPTFLGFGMQHLTSNTPFLKYASEAVMGFYILHQTVLLVIGYFVVQWAIPGLAKWAIIFVSSFVIIMAIYEYLVRRVNISRFLFGMKPRPKSATLTVKKAALAQK
ncbi:MAG TPA: acyltransferase [Anaerolineales bacterium]|nr:acyltransferase [Anaerolineales bacterium]